MKLTAEQKSIIESTGNLRVNAVAGSGKTSTIIEYAKARPKERIIYLAFNKSVRLHAADLFSKREASNVRVETIHSLAYKNIVIPFGYQIHPRSYKTTEIVEILKIKDIGDQHEKYILANHIARLSAYFCNSAAEKVRDLDYLSTIVDPDAHKFVSEHYEYLIDQTRLFLSLMDKGRLAATHDFYMKKFQLSKPELHTDYLLFDEGQDASAVMLNIFLRQKAHKVIVGDTNQQIYGWRYAVNSLETVDFPELELTHSFRFGQGIADLANAVLHWKRHLSPSREFSKIVGRGRNRGLKKKAILARSNLGLLTKAIELSQAEKLNRIYFEGHINSYIYGEDGTSLYDVMNLKHQKRRQIRDPFIKKMHDLDELTDYACKTEDKSMSIMIEIVKEYGLEIPKIINELKGMHLNTEERDNSDLIFSTVHRAKGLEYDSVELANDFVNEKKILEILDKSLPGTDINRLNEEINLLYVAITRTKNQTLIPQEILSDYIPKPPIFVSSKQRSK